MQNLENQKLHNNRNVLFRRIGSSIVLVSSVVWIIFSPHRSVADPFVGALAIAMVGMGLSEFFKLLEAQQTPAFSGIGIVAGCLLTLMEFLEGAGYVTLGGVHKLPVEILAVSFIHILLLAGVVSHGDFKRVVVAVSSTLFGVVYVSILFNFLIRIFYHSDVNGPVMVFYVILVTKSSDAGAYFVGSLIGKHAFVPHLSPGKTWEGVIGALITSITISIITCLFFPEAIGEISLFWAIVLGLVLGIGAMAGDLIESLFKRQSGLKDSGRIFPGIGGMLDLLDSLLFNAPILYFLVELFFAKGAIS